MALKSYIIRRLIMFIPVFLVSSALVFSLMHLAPGDPVELMFRGAGRPTDPRIIEEIREKFGLDKPLYEQYFIWIVNFFKGDLGYSYLNNRPVSQLIIERIWLTVELVLLSEILALAIGILLGVTAAIKKNTKIDALLTTTSLFGYCMPSFWFGIMLILIFAVKLRLFPTFGAVTPGATLDFWGKIIDNLRHLFLPLMTLTIGMAAWYVRLVRSSMLDVLNMDYIKTARAKGLKEKVVIYKHALRNALLPVVTSFGLSLGFVLGGAVVIETIFSWPGLGWLIVKSALARDYPVIMGTSMLIVLSVLIANLITDIVIALLDPRIKY